MTVEAKDEYNYVNDLAFTPDSRQLVAGSLSPWVRRWDVASRKPLSKLEGQDDKVSSVAISDDGARLAAGSDDNSVMVYDRNSNAPT
jgi:WD40 repeat protein